MLHVVMTNVVHTIVVIFYLMKSSQNFEIELRNGMHISTFPTPRKATIYYDTTTNLRANQTLRQILESNPLMKNLDMFKDDLTTRSYSYHVDPTWDKEPLVVFGRSPKQRKKLNLDNWHNTLSRRWKAHGAKTLELSPQASTSIYDNFGDEYQKFNESEFENAVVEVTDEMHTYPPIPTRSTLKPTMLGALTFNSHSLGIPTFAEKFSPTSTLSSMRTTITTKSSFQEYSLPSTVYESQTAPSKIVGVKEELSTVQTGRALADDEMVRKMLDESQIKEEYTEVENVSKNKPHYRLLGETITTPSDETTTTPFVVTESLITSLIPTSIIWTSPQTEVPPTPISKELPDEPDEPNVDLRPNNMFTPWDQNQLSEPGTDLPVTTSLKEKSHFEMNYTNIDDYPLDANGDRIEEVEQEENVDDGDRDFNPESTKINPENDNKNNVGKTYNTKIQPSDRPYDTRWLENGSKSPNDEKTTQEHSSKTTFEMIEKILDEKIDQSTIWPEDSEVISPTSYPPTMTPRIEWENRVDGSKILVEGAKRKLQKIGENDEGILESDNFVREEVEEEEENGSKNREYYMTPNEISDSLPVKKPTTPYFTEQLLPQFGTVHVTMPQNSRFHNGPSYNGYTKKPKIVDQKIRHEEFGRNKEDESYIVYDSNVNSEKHEHDSSPKIISHSNFGQPPQRIQFASNLHTGTKISSKKGYLKTLSEIREIKHNPIKKPNYNNVLRGEKVRNHILTTTIFTPLINPVMNPDWKTRPASLIRFPEYKPLSKSIAVDVKSHGIKNLQKLMEPEKPTIEAPADGNPLKWGPRITKSGKSEKLLPIGEDEDDKEFTKKIDKFILEGLSDGTDYDDGVSSLPKKTYRKTVEKCFKITPNALIANFSPLERKITKNETECIEFCVRHPKCLSLTYTEPMSLCDIYDVKNGTRNIYLLRYLGSTYYEPKNLPISNCFEEKNPKIFDSKTHVNQEATLVTKNFFTPTISNTLQTVISHLLSQPVIVTSDDTEDVEELKVLKTTPIFVETPTESPSTNLIDNQRDTEDFCPENKDIAILKTDGYRLKNFAIKSFHQNSTESECVFSCFINLAEGDHPYECVSSTYNRRSQSQTCTLHPQGSNIQGNGHLLPDSMYVQYEKTCILSAIVDHCKGFPIIRQPQKTLVGYTFSANTADNLVHCLELCYREYQKDQACKSIMYFYEETIHNCLLNSESQKTQPEFYVDEAEVIVDYASFDECFDIIRNPDLYEPPTRISDEEDEDVLPKDFFDPTLRVEKATTVRPFYPKKKPMIDGTVEKYPEHVHSFKIDSDEIGILTNDVRFRRKAMKN